MPIKVLPRNSAVASAPFAEVEFGPETLPPGPIHIGFKHGLGDCVNFATVLQLYVNRGYHCVVQCLPEYRTVFEMAGIYIHDGICPDFPAMQWQHALIPQNAVNHPRAQKQDGKPGEKKQPARSGYEIWRYNQMARNISAAPLPMIGIPGDLWHELAETNISGLSFISLSDMNWAQDYLARLPRPVILMHTQGQTNRRWKSLPIDAAMEASRIILDRCDGSIVVLNEESVPELASWRYRNLAKTGNLGVSRLLALIDQADLIAGVDSGPLQLARFSNTLSVGLFPSAEHLVPSFTLPRRRQINITPDRARPCNSDVRIRYNIIECKGPELSGDIIADTCMKMLSGPTYLDSGKVPADVQLHQFTDWMRGRGQDNRAFIDRDISSRILLREIKDRFTYPLVLETGCINKPEDWGGEEGYLTYLIGAFLQHSGGRLIAINTSPTVCRFARAATRELKCVRIVQSDPADYLKRSTDLVDVFIPKSTQSSDPCSADQVLNELFVAMPKMHNKSLIVFDATSWDNGKFTGRGAKALLWLKNQGWKVIYSGYQTICSKV